MLPGLTQSSPFGQATSVINNWLVANPDVLEEFLRDYTEPSRDYNEIELSNDKIYFTIEESGKIEIYAKDDYIYNAGILVSDPDKVIGFRLGDNEEFGYDLGSTSATIE